MATVRIAPILLLVGAGLFWIGNTAPLVLGQEATVSEIARLEKHVDQVLELQDSIMKQFDAVLEEVRIIKVRASSRSAPTS